MTSIEEFLSGLNLEQYEDNLKIYGVKSINDITEDVLVATGIDKPGHRKRILTKLNLLNCNTTIVNTYENMNNNISDGDDEPPPMLPPKSSTAKPQLKPPPPLPPTRSSSTKPVKPPRDFSKSRVSSLPQGTKLNQENYHVLSPVPQATPNLPPMIPPREDLGEATIGVEQQKQKLFEELKFKAPEPPIAANTNATSPEIETGILIDIPQDTPPARPVPAPRRPNTKVSLPVVTIDQQKEDKVSPVTPDRTPETKRKMKNPHDVAHTEDSSDEGEMHFPDFDMDNEPEEKTMTISMREDNETFQKLMSESTLNRTQSEKLEARKSRFFGTRRTGYLHKKGGQKGNKQPKKRYIEFDGTELKYFKEKNGEPLKTIPLSRMTDVEIEPGAKKPTFHLKTLNRRFTFFDSTGNKDEVTMWVLILMEAIKNKPDVPCTLGGEMADPDMEGWLLKQGHGVIQDIVKFKERYVAIKGDKLCYYESFNDFQEGLPITMLEMSLTSLKEDEARKRLILSYHTSRVYVFETLDNESFELWKQAIETAIAKGLGDEEVLEQLHENESNKICADCRSQKNVVWASLKFLVVVCDKCIGRHRYLGQNVSKPRSILMDVKVWTEELIELFKQIGNENANKLWACKLPSDDQITPDCSMDERERFIIDKYGEKKYFKLSEHFGLEAELGEALRNSVVTDDVVETLRLIHSGACVVYVPEGSEDQRTPYQLANDAGKKLQMELLSHHQGHLSLEEWEEKQKEEAAIVEGLRNKLPNLPSNGVDFCEKSGLLMMRMNDKDNWREPRLFQLKERRLEYKSSRSEEMEVIDLKTLEEIKALSDKLTFTLTMTTRTYHLKAFTPEDCITWYQAIKNKQTFGVALDKQELTAENIPYLLDTCIKYMEVNALTEIKTLTQEGIYRRNGGQGEIKRLITRFNQDPVNVRLTIEECNDVHAVAGLMKKYLRDLPESLLTNALRDDFMRNTDESIEHNERMYTYRDLIKSLPEVNHLSLRALVLHLHLVTELAEYNKMGTENIMIIFGPIIASCGETLDETQIRKEYKILKDLMTYYEWLFDVTENEMNTQKSMLSYIRVIEVPMKPAGETVMSAIQITIFVNNVEDLMKVDKTTKPDDVCQYFIEKHDLNSRTNWGLFEVTNDSHFERPVHCKESIYDLAISLSNNGKLVVKENHLIEKLAPHQSASFNSVGYMHYSSKGTNWKKNYYLEIKNGYVRIASKRDANKDEDKFGIHETKLLLSVGTDPKKKPPGKYGFVLKLQESYNQKDGNLKHFCSDNEYEVNMFMAAILNIRYPAGIWSSRTSKDLSEVTEQNKRESQFWGRQSMILQPAGISNQFANQLQSKRGTLRRLLKQK